MLAGYRRSLRVKPTPSPTVDDESLQQRANQSDVIAHKAHALLVLGLAEKALDIVERAGHFHEPILEQQRVALEHRVEGHRLALPVVDVLGQSLLQALCHLLRVLPVQVKIDVARGLILSTKVRAVSGQG